MTSERISEAITAVSAANREDAYLFVEDEAGHFLAETVLTVVACALLQSFLMGLIQAAKDQAAKLGSSLAEQIAKHVTSATSAASSAVEATAMAEELAGGVDAAAAEAARIVHGKSGQHVNEYALAAEAALILALRERGYTQAAAKRVATVVRQSALTAIGT